MTTSEMIKKLCSDLVISQAEVARRIGQTPQNFSKKLQRESLTLKELTQIADALGVTYEQVFTLPSGVTIVTGNKPSKEKRNA